MNNKDNIPAILDEILYHNLRPWLEENNPDEKFAPMLAEIKTENVDYQYHYDIEFRRPFNHKTKYYNKLIINSLCEYCNEMLSLINEDTNTKLQKYWLNEILNNRLKTRLKDIGRLIRDNDYSLAYINPKKTSFNADAEHKTNTYIIQLLKLAYIKAYLEIQEPFRDLIADALMTEDDFYMQLLFEPVPLQSICGKYHIR